MYKAIGYCVFLLLFFENPNGYSQEVFPKWGSQTFYGGVIGGANFSTVTATTDKGVHKIGMNGGVMGFVNFSKNCGLSVEILYSQKGCRFAREAQSVAGPYYIVYYMKLNYIEIPVLIQGYITERIHLGAGMSYNRLANSKEAYRSLYGWEIYDSEKFIYEKSVLEYLLSASYRLTKKLLVDVRYEFSANPIRKAAYVPEKFSEYRDQNSRVVALRLGYFF